MVSGETVVMPNGVAAPGTVKPAPPLPISGWTYAVGSATSAGAASARATSNGVSSKAASRPVRALIGPARS